MGALFLWISPAFWRHQSSWHVLSSLALLYAGLNSKIVGRDVYKITGLRSTIAGLESVSDSQFFLYDVAKTNNRVFFASGRPQESQSIAIWTTTKQ
jgi:hypothetical protein